ncbi:MAG: ATP-dependent Clp protease proteolytic subunit [Treponemataceae bacterium]
MRGFLSKGYPVKNYAKAKINAIIAEETGIAREKVAADTDRDYWLNADEAIDYGLISKIVFSRKDLSKK